MTTTKVTEADIQALANEALAAGDEAQYRLCKRAMGAGQADDAAYDLSHDEAWAECERVIREARVWATYRAGQCDDKNFDMTEQEEDQQVATPTLWSY